MDKSQNKKEKKQKKKPYGIFIYIFNKKHAYTHAKYDLQTTKKNFIDNLKKKINHTITG